MTPSTDIYIRCNHPASFRSGQWAKVTGVSMFWLDGEQRPQRPVFNIMFIDGVTDEWPIYNSGTEYEFSNAVYV